MAAATGFSVQVAQLIGAGKDPEARAVLRQALMATVFFSILLVFAGLAVSYPLPVWLRADEAIRDDAMNYFRIYVFSLPAVQLCLLAANMLQCSGNMRTPSMLNVLMCGMDVVFNALLIFPARTLSVFGLSLGIPGAGLGVAGAALGTALAQLIAAALMLKALLLNSPSLRLKKGTDGT